LKAVRQPRQGIPEVDVPQVSKPSLQLRKNPAHPPAAMESFVPWSPSQKIQSGPAPIHKAGPSTARLPSRGSIQSEEWGLGHCMATRRAFSDDQRPLWGAFRQRNPGDQPVFVLLGHKKGKRDTPRENVARNSAWPQPGRLSQRPMRLMDHADRFPLPTSAFNRYSPAPMRVWLERGDRAQGRGDCRQICGEDVFACRGFRSSAKP